MQQMPYVRDGIGITPRYMYKRTSRCYDLDRCILVANRLKKLGIQYQKKEISGQCAVSFGDSYEAFVDEIRPRIFTFPFLP